MKKGRREKVCGISIYRKYEKKSLEERGVSKRPVIFRSKKDYDRNREKKKLRNETLAF